MNVLRLIFAIQLAGVIVTVPAMAYLQEKMIAEINRTGRFTPVRHVWRLGLAQSAELEEVYGQFYPDSWKLDFYRVLRQLSLTLGGSLALLLTTQKLLHVYLQQAAQP